MNKQAQAFLEALGRQGIGADISGTTLQLEKDLATVRLRFDRVALRFVGDVQSALREAVPFGRTLVFTITAPIRRASRTAGALEEKLRHVLAVRTGRITLEETINGNRIRVRLLKSSGASSVVGFVHNPDCDPDSLFAAIQSLLRRLSPR